MSNLRDIVRRHIENETFNELNDIPLDQRPSMLDFLRKEGHIDKKVNDVLEIYQRELEKENVKYKTKRKIWKVGYAAISAILTIMISYFVNETQWFAIWAMAAIQIIISLVFILIDE